MCLRMCIFCSNFGCRLGSDVTPKVRSLNAAHTTIRSYFYKKIGFALLYHLHSTIMSKLP